jgi:hypothetical protein
LSVLPALLAIVIAIPRSREFFSLQLPPLLVWAAVIAIDVIAAAMLFVTERTASAVPQVQR